MRATLLLALLVLSGCTDSNSANGSGDTDGLDSLPEGMFRVGGTIENYRGRGLALSLNFGTEILDVPIGFSTFTFRTLVADGGTYHVNVATNPISPAQDCFVTSGQGTVNGASIESIAVDCDLQSFTVGGFVSGLREGTELVLQNNGGDDLLIDRTGAFTFSEPLAEGEPYEVTLLQEPVDPVHTCTLEHAQGVISGRPVRNVAVACKLHCGPSITCGETTFCDAPCGDEGLCEPRPTSCDPTIRRVCGCDDTIYNNVCEANRSGVSSRSLSACRARTCDDNGDCEEGELCLKERGACEELGTCLTVPGACDEELDPVCSCDGETFRNECQANIAGASADFSGECDGT